MGNKHMEKFSIVACTHNDKVKKQEWFPTPAGILEGIKSLRWYADVVDSW